MNGELNERLDESKELGELAKKCAQEIFNSIDANSQSELNTKSSLFKKAFLNKFESEYKKAFSNSSAMLENNKTMIERLIKKIEHMEQSNKPFEVDVSITESMEDWIKLKKEIEDLKKNHVNVTYAGKLPIGPERDY